MPKILAPLFKIKYFINYLYYMCFSLIKNTYPYKLIGEKINPLSTETIVLYKILGSNTNYEIPLKHLLDNKKLIENFHPTDALKLGAIAFDEIIFALPESERKTSFEKIKTKMLNSTHDTYPNRILESLSIKTHKNHCNHMQYNPTYLDSVVTKNKYPYKLVGAKSSSLKKGTTIMFTIFGKREGYEKILQELLNDKLTIEKFHPTETVKFGFIALGDALYEIQKNGKPICVEEIKNKIINL